MAYFRGDIYIWDDESGFHFWNKNGYDGWDLAAWSADESGESSSPGFENASGVSLPVEVIDAFVMMRLAKIIDEGRIEEVIDQASGEFAGNNGSACLMRNATKIKELLKGLDPTDDSLRK